MTMLFRQLWILANALRSTPGRVLEPQQLTLRVLPNDLDVNGHLNNARYLNFVDLANIHYFVRMGFLKPALRNRWKPVSGGSIIQYRKSLQPLQSFTLTLSAAGWDDAWGYFRFTFSTSRGVHALGLAKGAVLHNGERIPMRDAFSAIGHHAPSPVLPEDVRAWMQADAALAQRAQAERPPQTFR